MCAGDRVSRDLYCCYMVRTQAQNATTDIHTESRFATLVDAGHINDTLTTIYYILYDFTL